MYRAIFIILMFLNCITLSELGGIVKITLRKSDMIYSYNKKFNVYKV